MIAGPHHYFMGHSDGLQGVSGRFQRTSAGGRDVSERFRQILVVFGANWGDSGLFQMVSWCLRLFKRFPELRRAPKPLEIP